MTNDKNEKTSSTSLDVKTEHVPLDSDSDIDEFDYKDPNNDGINVTKTKKIALTASLCYIYMLANVAVTVLIPFFTPTALKRGVGSTSIAVIFAIYPLAQFIGSIVASAVILPRVGLNYGILAGMILEGGSMIIFGFLPEILDRKIFVAFCIITRVLQGCGAAFYLTAGMAFITSIQRDSIPTTMGMLEVSATIGLLLGPVLGGVLYQHGGYKVPFIVMGSVFIVSSLLVCAYPRIQEIKSSASRSSYFKFLRIPRVVMLISGLALQCTITSFLDPSFVIHIKSFHLSSSIVGVLLTVPLVSFSASCIFTGCLIEKLNNFRMPYIIGFIGFGVALQFMGPVPYLSIPLSIGQTIVSLFLMGAFIGISHVATFPDLLDCMEESKIIKGNDEITLYTVESGLANASIALGETIGLLIGGTLGINSNEYYSWVFAVLGFLSLAQAVVAAVIIIFEERISPSTKSI